MLPHTLAHLYVFIVTKSNDFYPFQFRPSIYCPLNFLCRIKTLSLLFWFIFFSSFIRLYPDFFHATLPTTMPVCECVSRLKIAKDYSVHSKKKKTHKTKSNSKMTMLLFKGIPNIAFQKIKTLSSQLSRTVSCFPFTVLTTHVRFYLFVRVVFLYWTFIHHNSSLSCQCPFANLSVTTIKPHHVIEYRFACIIHIHFTQNNVANRHFSQATHFFLVFFSIKTFAMLSRYDFEFSSLSFISPFLHEAQESPSQEHFMWLPILI